MDADVCFERQCWAGVDGAFVNDSQMRGGLAAPTTWPVRPGAAVDLWFDKDNVGGYDAGWFRGIADAVGKVNSKDQQKVAVDFDESLTRSDVVLARDRLYMPGSEPEKPVDIGDGVQPALEVRQEDLPDVEVSATPYGLTAEQHAKLKELWYERGHYASRDRMWKLLQAEARKDGELEERTINRQDGPVIVATPYGIRYRQLGQWIRAQESMQLFKRPSKVRVYRSFILPQTPLKTLMVDTMDLGRWGGGDTQRQRFVISMIDPASRWVYSEIAPQRDAPRPQDSMAMIVNGLLSLRAGILKYDTANKSNVFDQTGALVHTLTLATDQGNELGGNKPEYRVKLAEKLLVKGLITDESMLKHRYNLASAPTQAAFIERYNQTLRQKLRLAVQSELGSISRTTAAETRAAMNNPKAWRALIARAMKANNDEVASGTGMTPNDYLRQHVKDGKRAVLDSTGGDDKERTAKAERELERQAELTVGTRVRLVNLSTEKAELRGAKKMQARFSEEVFTVATVSKRARRGGGNVSYLYGIKRANGQERDGRYHREQLQIVPAMEQEWNPGPAKGRALADRLRAEGTISGWDERHNRFERTGTTWAERRVDQLGESAWKRVDMTREKTLRRLEQYMKQGMRKRDAFKRLKASLETRTGPANAGPLAIMGKDD